MASMTIRDIDERLKCRLRIRAAAYGRSNAVARWFRPVPTKSIFATSVTKAEILCGIRIRH